MIQHHDEECCRIFGSMTLKRPRLTQSMFVSRLKDHRLVGGIIALIAFLVPLFLNLPGLSQAGHITLSIFLASVTLWIFEAIPIYATSLFVILMQVLLLSAEGVMGANHALVDSGYEAPGYHYFLGVLANPIIILFLAGFMLAEGAVKYNLDRSLTRKLLRPFGSKPSSILLGLMLVTGVMSAFMSNTATTAMMMTVIIPIVSRLDKEDPFRIALALSIPIAANVGGIATPIGTPPNAVVLASLTENGFPVTFTAWVAMVLPLAIIMLFTSWWLLMRLYPIQTGAIHLEIKAAGRQTFKSRLLYIIFGGTILLWMSEALHGIPTGLVSMVPIALLTMTSILNKDDIRKLPWEVLWLVAGGLALGLSLNQTGLSDWTLRSVEWHLFSPIMLLAMFAIVSIMLSSVLSHTVTATLLIPLAVSLTTSMDTDIGLLVAGVTIAVSTSLSMMLPISTPPNAIAISTGLVKTKDLAYVGGIIALISLLFILLFAVFYWPVFNS
jgi:solute carrier family 13 (sodium-dependent dicarboxylate transporter), member 2/3/5